MTQIRKNISIIVAIAENNAIGKDNQLLWHLSDDLKRFKRITTGHTLLMGRNTYLSLPNGALPNRTNIVITDISDEHFPDCTMAYSIDEALELVQYADECFVIGGGMIYSQLFPLAGKLYLTKVHQIFDADTYFPVINFSEWVEIESEQIVGGEKNDYQHTFSIYIRRQPD